VIFPVRNLKGDVAINQGGTFTNLSVLQVRFDRTSCIVIKEEIDLQIEHQASVQEQI
jgi:hypothetical protein